MSFTMNDIQSAQSVLAGYDAWKMQWIDGPDTSVGAYLREQIRNKKLELLDEVMQIAENASLGDTAAGFRIRARLGLDSVSDAQYEELHIGGESE